MVLLVVFQMQVQVPHRLRHSSMQALVELLQLELLPPLLLIKNLALQQVVAVLLPQALTLPLLQQAQALQLQAPQTQKLRLLLTKHWLLE